MGSGGGGSSQPTQTTVTNSNIPKELMPYAMQNLGKAQSLVDSPYQAYQGPQVAGFSDMQNQAFKDVQGMQVSPELAQAGGMAGMAGIGGLMAGQNYQNQATNPGAMQSWMSPYMQNVVDMQKKGAIADYARQMPGMGLGASRAGGLGGTRSAIMGSEAHRNLGNQLEGIQATGSQNAFQNAQQAQQFGANLGMQGLNTAMQGANTLGSLGQNAYTQRMGINAAQQQAGALQQSQVQRQYDQDQQNFATAQNHPYKQLGFMSDLIRGTPTGSSSSSVYGGQPSVLGQVAGLGAGLGGLYMGNK